jgi:hypothetical protein
MECHIASRYSSIFGINEDRCVNTECPYACYQPKYMTLNLQPIGRLFLVLHGSIAAQNVPLLVSYRWVEELFILIS